MNCKLSWQSISTLLALYVAIASIYSPLKTFSYFNLTWLLAMLIWILGTFIVRPNFFINMPLQRIATVFFIVYSCLIAYLSGNITIGNRFLNIAQIPFFYWVYQYNTMNNSHQSNYTIIKWTIPFLIITCIKTGLGLLEYPYLSRSIKTGGEESEFLWQQGIGGYELIYCITILSIIILYMLINTYKNNKIAHNLVLIIFIPIFLGVIILSNYFTALIMIVSSLFFMWLLKKREIVERIISISILFLVAVFNEDIIRSGINYLIDILNPGRTLERLISIQANFLSGQSNLIEFGDRWGTIETSLQSFCDNPILGTIINDISLNNELIGFGQHSQFLDTLALYGVFGVIQIYFVLQPFVIRLKGNIVLRNFSIIMLIVTIMLFTFNNVTPSVGLAIYLCFPTSYDWLQKKFIRH